MLVSTPEAGYELSLVFEDGWFRARVLPGEFDDSVEGSISLPEETVHLTINGPGLIRNLVIIKAGSEVSRTGPLSPGILSRMTLL